MRRPTRPISDSEASELKAMDTAETRDWTRIQALLDDGVAQRVVAELVGVSQGWLSKKTRHHSKGATWGEMDKAWANR